MGFLTWRASQKIKSSKRKRGIYSSAALKQNLTKDCARIWKSALRLPATKNLRVLTTHLRRLSSPTEHSFDVREKKRASLLRSHRFEGIVQSARADASYASGRRYD